MPKLTKKSKIAANPMEQERPFYHIINHLLVDGWTELADISERVSMWGKNGNLILVQQMQPADGVEVWYPSEYMKLGDLKLEISKHGAPRTTNG